MVQCLLSAEHDALGMFHSVSCISAGGVGEGNGNTFSRQNFGLRERSNLLLIFLMYPMEFRALRYLLNTLYYCAASDTSSKAFDKMLVLVCKKVLKVARQKCAPCFLSFYCSLTLFRTFYRNKAHPSLRITSLYYWERFCWINLILSVFCLLQCFISLPQVLLLHNLAWVKWIQLKLAPFVYLLAI